MSAFLFPGQGSQSPGMGKFLFENFKEAKHVFEEASDSIAINLKKLCFDSTDDELALTANTQPALLCTSAATAAVLTKHIGLTPSITAGHSIGEYASVVLGGAITLSSAMKAVRLRGLAMQEAVPVGQGGMLAVLGLDEEDVIYLCKWAEQGSGFTPLSPANYNCEGQIVISGNIKTINWLKENYNPSVFKNTDSPKRVKLIPLTVSAPFHCQMMLPAQIKMETFLKDISFKNSHINIIQNIDAEIHTSAESIKKNLIEQISGSVRWTQSMNKLKQHHIQTCFEVGNGSILKGLLKKIDSEYFKVYSTNSLDDLKIIESLSK